MATTPYEVLLRMRGGQTYAHIRTLTVENGMERENPPVDLSLAGPEFDAWKTAFNATTLAEKNAALASLQAAQATIATLTAERDAAIAERDSLQEQLTLRVNARRIPVYAFLERLSPQEQVAITQSSDVQVQIIEKRLLARSVVDLDAQRTIDGLDYFVSKGLLTPQRKTELLRDAIASELELT